MGGTSGRVRASEQEMKATARSRRTDAERSSAVNKDAGDRPHPGGAVREPDRD